MSKKPVKLTATKHTQNELSKRGTTVYKRYKETLSRKQKKQTARRKLRNNTAVSKSLQKFFFPYRLVLTHRELLCQRVIRLKLTIRLSASIAYLSRLYYSTSAALIQTELLLKVWHNNPARSIPVNVSDSNELIKFNRVLKKLFFLIRIKI